MGACVGVVVGVGGGVCVGVRDRDAPADADAEKAETGVSREDVAASAARQSTCVGAPVGGARRSPLPLSPPRAALRRVGPRGGGRGPGRGGARGARARAVRR